MEDASCKLNSAIVYHWVVLWDNIHFPFFPYKGTYSQITCKGHNPDHNLLRIYDERFGGMSLMDFSAESGHRCRKHIPMPKALQRMVAPELHPSRTQSPYKAPKNTSSDTLQAPQVRTSLEPRLAPLSGERRSSSSGA